MEFQLEREMAAPVQQWLESRHLTIKREFRLPWGICDFAACRIDPKRFQHRRSLGQRQSIGTHLRVILYSLIPDESRKKGIGIRRLRHKVGDHINESRVEEEVETLIKRRFVFRTPSGCLKSRNGWKPLQNLVVAVEAKLSRIADVHHQALRNLSFADESFAALPESCAIRLGERGLRRFADEGIGVLGVHKQGCSIILPPQRRRELIDPVVQMHGVEQFVTLAIKGT
jgi:hypothetical protein